MHLVLFYFLVYFHRDFFNMFLANTSFLLLLLSMIHSTTMYLLCFSHLSSTNTSRCIPLRLHPSNIPQLGIANVKRLNYFFLTSLAGLAVIKHAYLAIFNMRLSHYFFQSLFIHICFYLYLPLVFVETHLGLPSHFLKPSVFFLRLIHLTSGLGLS